MTRRVARPVDGDAEPRDGAPAYPIASVDNALRLLHLFGERKQLRVIEASDEIGVGRSTAHRLLQMLRSYGFVRQDPESKAYLAGPALVDIGLRAVRDLDIRSVARPHVQALADEVQETVNLVALQGAEVLCLDSIESPRALRVGAPTGMVLPAAVSASGRVLLAEMPLERVRELYPRLSLPTSTIRSRSALERELALTRERGYAVNRGEIEPDISAVAAPIRDARGQASFAITIAIPTSRLADDEIPEMGAAAIACAARISEALPW